MVIVRLLRLRAADDREQLRRRRIATVDESSALTRLAALLRVPTPGDKEAFSALEATVAELHNTGDHFAAGYGWERGALFAWGSPDDHGRAIRNAASEYLEAVQGAQNCTARGLAATVRLVNLFVRQSPMGLGANRELVATAMNEIANLVLSCESLVEGCTHLVRGAWVQTDLQDRFDIVVPAREVDWGVESSGPGFYQFAIPSPFQLFIETADYAGAVRIASLCPEAFTTPGLRAWRAAARGFLDRGQAVENFTAAASEFESDVLPKLELEPGRESWNSRNVDLWAPYFKARSFLAMAVREPTSAREHIGSAAALMPLGASGWVNSDVQRFRALLACLRQLTDGSADTPIDAIRREFIGAAQFGGSAPDDPLVSQFIELVAESLQGFAESPAQEITGGRLNDALLLLDRLPLLEPGLGEAARPAVGDRMLGVLLGPRNWVYERLLAIRDERMLQRLVLRLCRVSLPAYAQILHGPLEHGKDVVVLLAEGATTELRMYQVKVGTINTPVWRLAKQELEAMFEVPLPRILTGGRSPDRTVGRLVSNGHAGSNVLPEIEGWFTLQRERFGRDFDFIHIDGLVRWIYDDHLLNEFRAFVDDEHLA